MVQTAEKGLQWLKLVAKGTAGHGSQRNDDNPIVKLAEAVARIGRYEWPVEIPQATRELLKGVAELTGIEYSEDNFPALLKELGSVEKFVGPTFATSANPTALG
ncbi:peptidase dimerization domain-containing protein, partial [Brevibacterium paucivorans]|uniref:peptidase dimerization domain-containing protein n=1 Tax=Brevibacterium paucivorans TaxID=170994 RepID=UPI002155BF84